MDSFGIGLVTGGRIVVNGLPSMADQALFVEQQIEIFDDDDFGLSQDRFPILPRFDLLTAGVIEKYKPAYITIADVDTLGMNLNKTAPFRANEHTDYIGSAIHEDLISIASDKDWWSFLLIAGYQHVLDGDPSPGEVEEGLFRAEKDLPGFAVIYLEGVREGVKTYFEQNNLTQGMIQFRKTLDNAVAHEIGHGSSPQGRAHHNEEGLMGSGVQGADFSSFSIKRLRSSENFRRFD